MNYTKKMYNTLNTLNFLKTKHECPLCNYYGSFLDKKAQTGFRKHAECPKCSSNERHRLQKLVIDKLAESVDFSNMRMLHFAPEPFFKRYFKETFKDYVTADLYVEDVDVKADITNLPFKDAEYDFVFASHVLEHIKEDLTALSEIQRVLKPNGIAILPVPLVATETIEYPEPNPYESGHVRAPGFDYYERYCKFFSHIDKFSSSDFPIKFQTYTYENRSGWPNEKSPLRKPIAGEKHIDIVPVCFA